MPAAAARRPALPAVSPLGERSLWCTRSASARFGRVPSLLPSSFVTGPAHRPPGPLASTAAQGARSVARPVPELVAGAPVLGSTARASVALEPRRCRGGRIEWPEEALQAGHTITTSKPRAETNPEELGLVE